MSLLVLYLLLLKATATSFSGVGSLPVVRDEFVVKRKVLTDLQLNAAVAVGRSTPGPTGLYVVSVGYFIRGVCGAIVAWLAMITPALTVIALLHCLSRRADHPRVRSVMQAVVIASGGLTIAATVPLMQETLTAFFPILICVGSLLVLVAAPRLGTIWVILGSACAALTASYFHLL
jgi:chromate transporter